MFSSVLATHTISLCLHFGSSCTNTTWLAPQTVTHIGPGTIPTHPHWFSAPFRWPLVESICAALSAEPAPPHTSAGWLYIPSKCRQEGMV